MINNNNSVVRVVVVVVVVVVVATPVSEDMKGRVAGKGCREKGLLFFSQTPVLFFISQDRGLRS